MSDLTLDTLIASVRYGPEADSRAAEAELRRRLTAAPPPAGALDPLCLAFVEAVRTEQTGTRKDEPEHRAARRAATDAWLDADPPCPIWLEGK